ncbi:transposase [Crocosphaera sp.]|uniref:transposase n=1 Tax=Crocosphaera sp. TaxID=2729996 RepID=UPI003F212753|nr:transposase [Crocosphaera sp.]
MVLNPLKSEEYLESSRRTNNAVVEGINKRLKVFKCCIFGFRNINNFKNGALLFLHLTDSLA